MNLILFSVFIIGRIPQIYSLSSTEFNVLILSSLVLGYLGLINFPKPKTKAIVKINFDANYNANYIQDPKPIVNFRSKSLLKPTLFILILLISITKISELYVYSGNFIFLV